MRVFLAGIFVIAGILLPVNLFGNWLEHASPAWVVVFGVGNGLFCVVLCIAAWFIFNTPIGKQAPMQSDEEYVRELEAQRLLVSTEFQAIQAFEMLDFGDEGSHYFLKLADGSVLYLNGQYLDEYLPVEPLGDDAEIDVSHIFPCTDFTIRRHRDKGFVVDIICRGKALETDMIGLDDSDEYPDITEKWPDDGEILTGQAFNKLKAQIEGKRN